MYKVFEEYKLGKPKNIWPLSTKPLKSNPKASHLRKKECQDKHFATVK